MTEYTQLKRTDVVKVTKGYYKGRTGMIDRLNFDETEATVDFIYPNWQIWRIILAPFFINSSWGNIPIEYLEKVKILEKEVF